MNLEQFEEVENKHFLGENIFNISFLLTLFAIYRYPFSRFGMHDVYLVRKSMYFEVSNRARTTFSKLPWDFNYSFVLFIINCIAVVVTLPS